MCMVCLHLKCDIDILVRTHIQFDAYTRSSQYEPPPLSEEPRYLEFVLYWSYDQLSPLHTHADCSLVLKNQHLQQTGNTH